MAKEGVWDSGDCINQKKVKTSDSKTVTLLLYIIGKKKEIFQIINNFKRYLLKLAF